MTPRRPARERGGRRIRGAAESLGSIVLVFESVIVFLSGLVVYGLKALPTPVEQWWGIVGGAVLALLMIGTAGTLRSRGGLVVGWVLQLLLVLSGILVGVPAITVVGVLFAAMWGYATIKGAALDRRNARLARETDTVNGD